MPGIAKGGIFTKFHRNLQNISLNIVKSKYMLLVIIFWGPIYKAKHAPFDYSTLELFKTYKGFCPLSNLQFCISLTKSHIRYRGVIAVSLIYYPQLSFPSTSSVMCFICLCVALWAHKELSAAFASFFSAAVKQNLSM